MKMLITVALVVITFCATPLQASGRYIGSLLCDVSPYGTN
jgi:hypothetical protein